MEREFPPPNRDGVISRVARDNLRFGGRGTRILTVLVAVAALLGVGVVVLYAYNKGRQVGEGKVPPVIKAKEGPSKIRPETPGGMTVPDQDKEVFTRLEASKQPNRVERLLPPPEKPMLPPTPAMKAGSSQAASKEQGAKTSGPVALATPPRPPSSLTKKNLEVMGSKPAQADPGAKPQPNETTPKTKAKTPTAERTGSVLGQYRVQVSSLRSEPALRKNWASLQKKHKDLLGKLSLIVERTVLSGGRGTFFRMQAGPLASRDEALVLCSKLKQRKLGCLVVRR